MAKASKNKKQPINHRHKRHGLHQKRTDKFLKTYWPYLPMLTIVVIGIAINIGWTHLNHSQSQNAISTITAHQLLKDNNQARDSYNVTPLHSSTILNEAAQARANDMVANNYWSHISPSGKTPWYFIDQTGYKLQAAAENLAFGFSSSDTTNTAWLNSPEHRSNLMNKDYSDVGFGVAKSPNFHGKGSQIIVVALYAKPSSNNSVIDSSKLQDLSYDNKNNTNVIDLTSNTQKVSANIPSSQNISRIQLLTNGNAPWSLLLGAVIAILLATLFIIKHARGWHKFIVKSEDFIIHHAMLDSVAICLIMIDLILSHGTGTIL